MSILLVLWVVTMFLWLISTFPNTAPLAPVSGWLPWFAVLFLGLHLFFGVHV